MAEADPHDPAAGVAEDAAAAADAPAPALHILRAPARKRKTCKPYDEYLTYEM